MKKLTYDVIVIGGGAAGLLASALAAEQGLQTLLLEHQEKTGRKLRITGKGRCNVTNHCSPREVIDNIPTGGRFLFSAMNAFPPEMVMAMFESMGVPLKTERGNRVFPVSDHAGDIVGALNKRIRMAGVELIQDKAEELLTEGSQIVGVRTSKGQYNCRQVILCTGGMSYPLTGSDGSGYSMAAQLGHRIVTPKASLVPLEIKGEDCPAMQGLSLKNVAITISDGGKKPIYEDFGELLFTHFGVSGPLILSASAHLKDYEKKKYVLSIDLKPALDEKTLDARLLRDFSQQANRDFSNSLGGLAHKLMIPVLVRRSEIPPQTKVNSITKQQRRRLLELLKGFTLEIEGPRPVAEAIITSGGVDCSEINPKTMESKLVTGLFFAGEIINCDAYTGGFNLQIAWATAYAAATHLAEGEYHDKT